RERIGREVHDVLGHRLSLLNLHAGALESHAPPDGPLGESARLVRESAARAMEDLRSLLDMLNDPLEAGPAEPDLSLVDLPEMITNARRHAPGRPTRREVHGGPSRGMYIDARNPYGPPAAPGQGGQGLRGIAERVELLGGTLRYGLDEGGRTFRVTVELPWR